LESSKGKEPGCYSILVDKEKFEQIRATLKNSLSTWVKEFVEIDAQPTEFQFLGPAHFKPLFDDGLSSGENSWMTTSNACFMSIEFPSGQDDDFLKTSMNANRIFTYDHIPSCSKKSNLTAPPPQGVTEQASTKDHKSLAWSTATSDLTEVEMLQQLEIIRLTAEQTQATQATIKSNPIIADQQAEIEKLKAQQLADIDTRAKEVMEARR
jgi:hypothetical protein